MYKFDESILIRDLKILQSRELFAFATAAATRQLGNYERYALMAGVEKSGRPREITSQLWIDLKIGFERSNAWSDMLSEVMAMLPNEDEWWGIHHALADDALSSLAYAIRCFQTGDPQEGAWAARRAYEAADQAAVRLLGIQASSPGASASIEGHNLVQRELQRQAYDLQLLRAGAMDDVRKMAFEQQLLTSDEARSFS